MGINPESRSNRLLRRTICATSTFAFLGAGTAVISIANAESSPAPAYASPFPAENNTPQVTGIQNTEPSNSTTSVTLFEKSQLFFLCL